MVGLVKTYTIPNTIAQFTGGTPCVKTFSRIDIVPFTTLIIQKTPTRMIVRVQLVLMMRK